MNVYIWHDDDDHWRETIARSGFLGGTGLPVGYEGVLVCWRKAGGADAGTGASAGFRRCLNDPACAPADDGQLGRKLALYGLKYEPVKAGGRKAGPWLLQPDKLRWAVRVFDMKVLDVRRLPDGEETGGDVPPARLARLAVRAVYASGLDFATVIVRQDGVGKAVIEGLDGAPDPAGNAWRLWQPALVAMAAEDERRRAGTDRVVLGMDPEFVLLNKEGKVVPASRYFPRSGEVGFDRATVPGRANVHPLAELRPAPSAEPERLIRSLRRTMWIAARRIDDPGLRWIAGGMPVKGLPLGGHIHFSGVGLNSALVRALDNYLALPLLLLEDESATVRRKRYGKPGDTRVKDHGGFEYRTLPSVLVSPRITKGAVALAKLIAENYEQLPERPLDDPRLLAAFVAGDKPRLARVARKLWQSVAKLPDYPAWARYLDPLLEWLEAGITWQRETDFRKAWRIPPFR